jgi:uncharacterized protein
MRWFILCLLLLPVVAAQEVQITAYVNDYADIFTPEEELAISTLAEELYTSGRIQYAVVTTPSLDGMPIEDYSITLAQGSLGTTEQDNGLLLVIAPTEREYRFEVGSGAEGTFTDARVGRIGRTYLVPAFREGKYGEGTLAATTAVRDLAVDNIEPVEQVVAPQRGRVLVILLIILVFVLFMSWYDGKKRRKNRRSDDDYYSAALGASSLFGGRGGGGSFGGGFGGFGGGGFSGGGGGGSW